VKRREFITLLGGAAAWPLSARAQQANPRRIGFLRVGPPPPTYIGGFREGLREQGLLEGRDVVIEFALAQNATQIPKVATELASSQVDVILAAGTPSVFPAKAAAGHIPVVFVATFDPVATGLVTSLARPGGNVTGMTTISSDLVAKRVQLIKEFFPDFTKIAILVREASPTAPHYIEETQSAAQKLGFALQVLAEHDPKELDKLFVAARASEALVVGDDTEFTAYRTQMAELALKNHLPTIHGLREMVDAGASSLTARASTISTGAPRAT
jgi:putative ABC transport system substrate-binding protein